MGAVQVVAPVSEANNLTREEIDRIIDTVAQELERQRIANGHSRCSTCGAPLGARFDVPTECSACLRDLTIPEFLRQ